MKINFIKATAVIGLIGLIAGLFSDCKKIDLVRIAAVKTDPVTIIYTDGATVYGNIIDLGEDDNIQDFGFCWFPGSSLPTINDPHLGLGETSLLGFFSATIYGLQPNTDYNVRSYVKDANGVNYGNPESFHTLTGGISPTWLNYDDGTNFTGVGLTDGSNFDYAVRFPTQMLTQYNGFRITKIRFFPKVAAQYHVEVYEGVNPPDFVYYEDVPNPVINGWTEYNPTNQYYINSAVEVWVGIWVTDYITGTYPGGVDDGPAIAGAGDMISFDNGLSWVSLYADNPALNYNWNLQVYITNQKGEEFLMNNEIHFELKEKPVSETGISRSKPISEIENLNY
jgi:hypothetical protein